jgi:DNA polymerase-3 subunit gamma/tau
MAKELARNCTLESFDQERLTLNLAAQYKHLLTNKAAQDKLQTALTKYFVQPVRLVVIVAGGNVITPAAIEQAGKKARQQQAVEAITQDPFVCEAQAQLGAQVAEDSIKPL